jgi:hypothetical protein
LGTHPPSTQPAINLGALLTTMLQAQADSQMAIAWQMAYDCHLMPDLEESTSALTMD